MKKIQKFENRIKEIRESIKSAKKPIVFFDCDTDGATSYLQLKNEFPKLKGFALFKDIRKQKESIDNYLDSDVDLVLICDIPFLVEEFFELVLKKTFDESTNSSSKIAWVDHHPTNSAKLIEKYDVLHLNPLNYDENDNRAVSYLCYLISDKNRKNFGLVALGSVADFYLLDVIKNLYKFKKREFKTLFPKLSKIKREELFEFLDKYNFNDKRVKGKRDFWIQYLTYDCGLIKFKNFFDFMFKFKDSSKINEAFKIVEKLSLFDLACEMNSNKGFLFENYGGLMEKYSPILNKALKNDYCENLYLFEYGGEISFTKTLAEEVCYRRRNVKVIGICFKKNLKNGYSCSFRGNNYVVNSLVSNALTGLDGMGGGHEYAAGARVEGKDYYKFKKRIEKKLLL